MRKRPPSGSAYGSPGTGAPPPTPRPTPASTRSTPPRPGGAPSTGSPATPPGGFAAARAQEVLTLDVGELDLPNRRAKVRRKGGAADIIVWRTATARLLPRLLQGRRAGPVFLTDRRTRIELPTADLDTASGRARLSYRRAAECFERATEKLPNGPWTLHQLRHSALTHAAEDGANTSTLLAYSGHTSVASLARYARVSPQALARWQGTRVPAARRR